tara:strand:+ start:504 stop:746 length:243 start_codon:yes stop_codon:yes gene_type:complete
MRNKMYTVVGRQGCTYCSKAMGTIRENGGIATYYSLDDTKWLLDLFKKAGITTVPQVWDIKGNHIGGYEELQQHLKGEQR